MKQRRGIGLSPRSFSPALPSGQRRRAWMLVLLFSALGNLWLIRETLKRFNDHYLDITVPQIEKNQDGGRQTQTVTVRDGRQSPKTLGRHQNTTSSGIRSRFDNSFSMCLLIKDDNDILSEWVAYHYHVIRLRTLIVAIDPESQTSPEDILKKWSGNFDLQVELWSDKDFMPDFFLQGQFDRVPRLIKYEDNATKWQDKENPLTSEELEKTFHRINNHRFRQSKFLQTCSRRLKQLGFTWVTHIDDDEYITINPILRREGPKYGVPVPKVLGPDSILKFFTEINRTDSKLLKWPCISMPRVLYGSKEDADTFASSVKNDKQRKHFESLRWKYHADYKTDTDVKINGLPKVIMDITGFTYQNLNLTKVFSIHRPNIQLCRRQGQMNMTVTWQYPISVNHYVGSLERYQSRADPRRTTEAYWKKARVADGKDDDWMDTWLESFLAEHGMQKALTVLEEYKDEILVQHQRWMAKNSKV